jgi:hypothetical protein
MEQKKLSRIAGVLYLAIVAGGIFAEAFVRGRLVDHSDAAATARNILSHEMLFRVGFSIELLVFVCDSAVTALFYILLTPINRTLSTVATVFRGITVAMLAINLLNNFLPILLLKGTYFQSFAPDQLQSLSLLFMKVHGMGYALGLVFFGVHCILLGYLLCKARNVPNYFGIMMALAGICYIINSYTSFLFPAVSGVLFPVILAPAFIAELSLSLWLILKGITTGPQP